jgi:hypothetical protein
MAFRFPRTCLRRLGLPVRAARSRCLFVAICGISRCICFQAGTPPKKEWMLLFIRKEDQDSEDRLLANSWFKDYIRRREKVASRQPTAAIAGCLPTSLRLLLHQRRFQLRGCRGQTRSGCRKSRRFSVPRSNNGRPLAAEPGQDGVNVSAYQLAAAHPTASKASLSTALQSTFDELNDREGGPSRSHSSSFDHRLRPDTLRTAIAMAFFWPTRTTSRLPRVTPV